MTALWHESITLSAPNARPFSGTRRRSPELLEVASARRAPTVRKPPAPAATAGWPGLFLLELYHSQDRTASKGNSP